MNLFDRKLRDIPAHYVLQSALAALAVSIILLLMGATQHTTLIASLGASAFIVFTMPTKNVSKPRYIIGGYIVGIVAGVVFALLLARFPSFAAGSVCEAGEIVFGGSAVGVAIFLMVILDVEHPPAAGIALALVVNRAWTVKTLMVILGAVLCLCILKRLLRPLLRDLL